MLDYAISRAIRICDTQQELSRRTGLSREKISFLLNRAKKISLHDALLIEAATLGVVSIHDFLKFFSAKIQKSIKCLSFLAGAKASVRLIAAMACEKELSEERKAKKRGDKNCRNLDAQNGRIE